MDKQSSNYSKPYYYSSNRSPNNRYTEPPRQHRGKKRYVLIVLILAFIGIGVHFALDSSHVKSDVESITKSKQSIAKKPATTVNPNDISSTSLANVASQVNSIINNNSDIDMSVYLIDLNTNQSQAFGDQNAFTAASTQKVLTAVYFLHLVEEGQQSLSENVDGNTAQYEMQQMIVVSDDDAWDDLNEIVGYQNMQNYADSIGWTNYNALNNTLTSKDMAILLQKLWNGQLLNSSNTQLLLSYMKQANYRQYIVPAIPAGDTIYHKIGLYEDFVNDVAIVTNGSNSFIICIYTNGNGAYNWPERAQIMQQITQAVLPVYI